jgi:hypothetical protein
MWVVGNINLSGGGDIDLDSSYGTGDGVIITDGTLTATGGSHFDGSGVSGSYIVAISTASSTSAINISGGSGSVVLFAPYGTANFGGGASAKSVLAKQVRITGGSHVTYDSGLASLNFTGGSSASWQVDSWSEVSQ